MKHFGFSAGKVDIECIDPTWIFVIKWFNKLHTFKIIKVI